MFGVIGFETSSTLLPFQHSTCAAWITSDFSVLVTLMPLVFCQDMIILFSISLDGSVFNHRPICMDSCIILPHMILTKETIKSIYYSYKQIQWLLKQTHGIERIKQQYALLKVNRSTFYDLSQLKSSPQSWQYSTSALPEVNVCLYWTAPRC